MRNEDNLEASLERYITGELSHEEKETFKKNLLSSDDNIQMNVMSKAMLIKSINHIQETDRTAIEDAKKISTDDLNDLFNRLKEEDKRNKNVKKEDIPHKGTIVRYLYPLIKYAAVACVAIIATIVSQSDKDYTITDEEFEKRINYERGRGGGIDLLLEEASHNAKAEKYEQALTSLEKVDSIYQTLRDVPNRMDASDEDFEEYKTATSAYQKSQSMKSAIYLRMGKTKEAIDCLLKIK